MVVVSVNDAIINVSYEQQQSRSEKQVGTANGVITKIRI